MKQGIAPVGERTFYRERAAFGDQQVTTLRRGKRATYASAPFFWALDQTTPRHGGRPFARAHMDHTELDIVLVSSVTGKPMAKPWATFLTDAYSRRMLACYVRYYASASETIEHQFTKLGSPISFFPLTAAIRLLGEEERR